MQKYFLQFASPNTLLWKICLFACWSSLFQIRFFIFTSNWFHVCFNMTLIRLKFASFRLCTEEMRTLLMTASKISTLFLCNVKSTNKSILLGIGMFYTRGCYNITTKQHFTTCSKTSEFVFSFPVKLWRLKQ